MPSTGTQLGTHFFFVGTSRCLEGDHLVEERGRSRSCTGRSRLLREAVALEVRLQVGPIFDKLGLFEEPLDVGDADLAHRKAASASFLMRPCLLFGA